MKITVALLLALAVLLLAEASPTGYPQGPCEVGSTTMYECNQCRCAQDGSGYICSRLSCPSTPEPIRSRRATGECEPGTSWQQDCNTCTCTDTRVAACTLKACLPSNFGNE